MTVYRLKIEYDGTPFSGWQAQPGRKTVQGDLEAALATILRRPVRLQGAGRTDAGVHALGQVASFEIVAPVDAERLRKGLSALCRPHIAVLDAREAQEGFNARFSAKGKHYRYSVLNRSAPSPLRRTNTFHVKAPLDIDAMIGAASLLVGERDFSGFRAADCGRANTVRTLAEVAVTRDQDIIDIDVLGNAFLKNMVRIIAGTLVDVGLSRLGEDDVKAALSEGDRKRAGRTAPAHGLTLMKVLYDV